TSSGALPFDPEIKKTARAIRKAVRLAKEAAKLAELEQPTSEEELHEMADNVEHPPPPPRRTLGDYGQRNDGEV
ncbi:hypothetical protein A2U01_0051675, partial [Trifolium medium]|nr:hypothetical protein [Trifolium medium]